MKFPEPVLKAMKKATDEVLAGYAAENAEFKEVYESRRPISPRFVNGPRFPNRTT